VFKAGHLCPLYNLVWDNRRREKKECTSYSLGVETFSRWSFFSND